LVKFISMPYLIVKTLYVDGIKWRDTAFIGSVKVPVSYLDQVDNGCISL